MFGFKIIKETGSLFENSYKNNVLIKVDSVIKSQLDVIDLTEKDLYVLKTIQPYVKDNIESIVTSFYDRIQIEKSNNEIINKFSSVDRLKKTLESHVIQMFDGIIDDSYVKNRIKVAHVHVYIGLPTKWYLASFQGLLQGVFDCISPYIKNVDDYHMVEVAINKIFNFEQQLVIEAYDDEHAKQLQIEKDKQSKISNEAEMSVNNLHEGARIYSNKVQSIVSLSEEVMALMEEGTVTSDKASEMSYEGSKIMDTQSEEMEAVALTIEDVFREMKELIDISKEMQKINDIVKGIADETHLLSFNARIQSAHAGEYGRSFTVVSNEFQNLSDKSKESSISIEELIKRIVDKIEFIHKELFDYITMVKEGKDTSLKAREFFGEIVKSIDISKEINKQILKEMESVNSHLEEINENTQQIYSQTDSLQSIINELNEH